ncbi:MAG TPA: GNAT family N-acetyltransferase [Blastocatellia bacterium]|nr:GNAT family N-acetyltransferase [Blastocatellia bacterium]
MIDWKELPAIDAARVRLRSITGDDVDSLYTIFSDAEVMRYWSSPPLASREEAARLLDRIQSNFRERTFFQWGIALREDDKVIGTTTLFHLDLGNRRAEIGYALGRSHWGRGYIQEALNALFAFAFNDLSLHRLEADVDPRNARSIRTLERLGFQKEGYMRERWHVAGEIQDALMYGLLKHEWKSV